MGLDSIQIIKQAIRLFPLLAREVEASFTDAEKVDFNSIVESCESPNKSVRTGVSEYQREFVQHVVNAHSVQIDEIDAHCNKIYEQSLDVARDEEYGDVYHREQIELALEKSKSSVKEFLAVDLAIGASFFTKACKLLNDIENKGEFTKEYVSAFGVIHSEIELLGQNVLATVSGKTIDKYDLADLLGEVVMKAYGANGFSDTKQERAQLKEIFKEYGAKYKGLLVGLTKDMHYE